MSKDRDLAPGNVLGYVTGLLRSGDHAAWDKALDEVWPRFIAEMASNEGFKGAYALTTIETGEVSILGVWSSVATRDAYEKKSSGPVRAIFNALLQDDRRRYKQLVTRATWAE